MNVLMLGMFSAGLLDMPLACTMVCPFHNDKHLGSCRVYRDTNTFYCEACQTSGDALKLASGYMDIPLSRMNELLEEIVSRFGINRDSVTVDSTEKPTVSSKMLEQISRCLAEQAGGRAVRLDGGNAQSLCGKRQHLRRGSRWKGAYQQAKSDRVPHRAGCGAESYDSTDEKTTCWLQAGRKAIKSKGMVSRCA